MNPMEVWKTFLKTSNMWSMSACIWVNTAVLLESDFPTFIISVEIALLNCTRHIIVFVGHDHTVVTYNTLTNLK